MTNAQSLESLAARLLQTAKDREWRIATAESCTGGLVASLLTDIEGLGHVFERGFVTYSDEAKTDMLGIEQQLIDERGAVSAKVAEAMARGAQQRSRAELALAITGFAGPAGPGDEEGLVYVAARCGARMEIGEHHWGTIGRDAVRARSARAAMRLLLDLVEHDGK
ncbi:CinA family protein [Sphingopyxis sp. DHUNG17]|uniref:CinA family protein n=1 Tax=Sphingopyxis jiangsuensis TaxID=2871171 RepID=UPI00191F4FEB|nr:CinA family protein [Sphingopyxis lutea]MBL0767228.1 CinA family protein [Sphingopyxis lutea]